jgi:hypothetical protein
MISPLKLNERDRKECADHFARLALPVGGWQVAAHLTFNPSWPARSEWTAMKRFRSFMNERDRKNISWLAAVERNPDWHGLNPGHHLHALFADVLEIQRLTHFKRWAGKQAPPNHPRLKEGQIIPGTGWGNCKVERVRSTEAARNYLLKYVVKEGCMIDWQEAGELWRYRHPATP